MAEARYLLGLDAGNTVIKAVLFGTDGREVARAARDGASAHPAPGHVERDPAELWRHADDVIRVCLAEAAVDPSEIAAVGCAGHGNGLYLIDAGGEPLIGIQSIDGRAAALADELSARNGAELYAACLQRPWPSQTATLLAWVKANRPDVYAAAATVLLCKDLITFRLTGARVSDVSDMSGAGLVHMPEAAVDDGLLQLYGLDDAGPLMPRIADPCDVVGRVTEAAAAATGLAAGTPVVGGLFDVVASAVGSGAVAPGQASIITGTWSINQVLSDAPAADPSVFMVSKFGDGRYMNIDASATSAANLEWYVRTFVERGAHLDDPFGYCNARVAEVEPATDDPFFHPYLYGSGQVAAARGGFYGLAGWHSEGHILRALFEGVVFEHRRHVEVLAAAGLSFEAAVMSGGGARSPHWPQMMADCLGLPITVSEGEETGALGAAIAAGVGSGVFADLEAGVAAMTRVRQVYEPAAAEKPRYDDRYRTYLDLVDAMMPVWTALQAAREKGRPNP